MAGKEPQRFLKVILNMMKVKFGSSSEAPLTCDCISSFSFDDDSDIYNIQTNSECMTIGKNLMLSPTFPLSHTVREAFTSYGVPLMYIYF
ncbi:hypothetical protein ACUH7Y_10585 [Clostridium beijerinckii]|uniref:Uncharacterized protein n=1 Tax=Clostridium beijerinckii TaxID=1520 RepID=A0A7X9SRH1_CLOBE|nr:hypothetical protein [Clostridium beijerinckii]NMF06685.1 hypothetical protein [Clostridium beijerinckii]